MTVATAGLGLYVAVAGLYLADARRTVFGPLARSATARMAVRTSAWLVFAASLWALGVALGWEVGIPAWLGLLGAAGLTSVYLAALSRRWHAVTAAIAMLATIAGAALAAGG